MVTNFGLTFLDFSSCPAFPIQTPELAPTRAMWTSDWQRIIEMQKLLEQLGFSLPGRKSLKKCNPRLLYPDPSTMLA